MMLTPNKASQNEYNIEANDNPPENEKSDIPIITAAKYIGKLNKI